ncbi:MAG: bifunctional folylpolyglutamate synthase/dihydrofolate synthase [Rhodospirillaceae bacterium]|nr:bifunctional folylpolyglutamate synthase/dihydrofolate synthase [Alphaproteobacteria bacterium]MBR72004.1 bifunctional folylpolyglutamate synthase/dihydrofolate synthase [Rhodospirillaceae bacterium]
MYRSKTDQILARLMELHPKTIDLSLGRIKRLLSLLGNPEKKLPPIVHVAGTNGKGSVVAMLNAIMRCSGYRTHTYTSPHLINFNERITICGKKIDNDELANILDECEQINAGEPITFFEITTAAAFVAFSRTKADVLILEVGLGGRLDATNVITPLLTAITSISLDHSQFLGNTISKIAKEKAGILKNKVPAIIGSQTLESLKVIEAHAKQTNASLLRSGYEWNINVTDSGTVYNDESLNLLLPRPILNGIHQVENAGIAVCAALYLSKNNFSKIDAETIANGLESTVWNGRLQQIFWSGLSTNWEVWLDGGHNPGAKDALCYHIDNWDGRPLHLIVGMMDTKDVKNFVVPLAKRALSITAVSIPDQNSSIEPRKILSLIDSSKTTTRLSSDVMSAITEIQTENKRVAGRILVCGSLYLVGSVIETITTHQ